MVIENMVFFEEDIKAVILALEKLGYIKFEEVE